MVKADVAGDPLHQSIQSQVTGGPQRSVAISPIFAADHMHFLETVLREEQIAAKHRCHAHRQQHGEKCIVESAPYPKRANQTRMGAQRQGRVPMSFRILQQGLQADAESEHGQIAEQDGERMSTDTVRSPLEPRCLAPHRRGHDRKCADAVSADLTRVRVVIVMAVVPGPSRCQRERRVDVEQNRSGG